MRFNKVAVLKGGDSAEREVSLRSGAAIADGLRKKGYDVVEIDMPDRQLVLPADTDAVFIALHGAFGEDGGVQKELEARGIPYTGSGPESSRKAFDKSISKGIFMAEGIPTPTYEILKQSEKRTLSLPVVAKPVRQGSSVGVHRVFHEENWLPAFADVLQYGDEVLVESYISGTELTIGVVGDRVLPVLEIRAPEGYYDYRAKYSSGLTEYLVPAPVSDHTAKCCRELAFRAFKALGCSGMARVDFRLREDGALYVLEVNTIPGFTETSLLPKAARAVGIDFPDLCDMVLRLAMGK